MKAILGLLAVLVLTGFSLGSCGERILKKAGPPPRPNICDIHVTNTQTYLRCLDRQSQKEYKVYDEDVEGYLCMSGANYVDTVTYIRIVTVILEELNNGFKQNPIIVQLKQLHNYMVDVYATSAQNKKKKLPSKSY